MLPLPDRGEVRVFIGEQGNRMLRPLPKSVGKGWVELQQGSPRLREPEKKTKVPFTNFQTATLQTKNKKKKGGGGPNACS